MAKNKVYKDDYSGNLIVAKDSMKRRIMVGIPMTGLLRSEWVISRYGQVIPCNWSQVDAIHWLDQYSPLGFLVADARNIIASRCVEEKFEWLFFIDHDTILPPTTVLRMNERMLANKVPMWSGLYFTKSVPSEPLVYRGRGNGFYTKWKMGDEVWVDGIPMGCTMISSSILKVLYDESPSYVLNTRVGTFKARRIFETPSKTFFDPQKQTWFNATGTEDLALCSRIMNEGIFKKAGWKEYEGKKYPFMIDTNIFCRHIDWDGVQYPSKGEEQYFVKGK